MRKSSPKSVKQPSPAVSGTPSQGRWFREWPLLLYPALFLTTLAILYVVSRSIEKETPAQGPRPMTSDRAVASGRVGAAGDSLPRAAAMSPAPSSSVAAGQRQAHAGPNSAAAAPGPTPSVTDRLMQHATELSRLKGTARTTAMLRIAVEGKDRELIRQCIAELVTTGDAAVAPLSKLITEQEGDTALWAASALARLGTPAAAGALLDRLAQTQDGVFKEELGKRVAELSNHDSWPLLLDTMMQTTDTSVARAAGAALAGMADAPIVDEVMARYDSASTAAETERLAQLVRTIKSPKATESLLSLAGPVSAAPQDSLQAAAISALANIGNGPSVSYLLQRLESSPPGESAQIFNTITQISTPDAQTALLYAAAGNKEVSAENGQTAAIYALKNYPNEQTVALLQRIVAQGQNEKVVSAATRTLADIQQSPHAVTAQADTLARSEQMLPLKTIEK